jgi:hypothetical protein
MRRGKAVFSLEVPYYRGSQSACNGVNFFGGFGDFLFGFC